MNLRKCYKEIRHRKSLGKNADDMFTAITVYNENIT